MSRSKYRFTLVRKWDGDDAYSWAIFQKGHPRPLMTGLHRRELAYYRNQLEQQLALKQKTLFNNREEYQ